MEKKARLDEIDGLRGVACVSIVFGFHSREFFPNIVWMEYLAYFVEVFFIISGFMMGYNYKCSVKKISFKTYFSKRYIKLMSIYWIVFIVWVFILIYNSIRLKNVDCSEVNLLYLLFDFFGCLSGWVFPSLGINSWFFSVLNLCYILYYIILWFGSESEIINKQKYRMIVIGILVLSIIGIVKAWNYPFLYAGITLRGVGSFLTGSILYEIYKTISDRGGMFLAIIGDVIIVLTACFCKIVNCDFVQFLGNISVIMMIFICPVLVCNILWLNPVKKIFNNKIFRFFGSISMNVYLWHTVVLRFVHASYGFTIKGYIMMWILCLIIGSLSHFFVEPRVNNVLFKLAKI